MVNHKVVDLSQHVNNALFYKQLMDQLEDSQQHFDKTVQAALSDALFSTLYPLGQLFSQEKAILFLNFASQSDLAFHHNVYMTPQCVNIRYPYKERSTPSISKTLQNPVAVYTKTPGSVYYTVHLSIYMGPYGR